MATLPTRLLIGFAAGALSHVTFQGALSVIYYALDLVPAVTWSLKPLPPYGVPTTVNYAFWAGLWGIVYALLEPRLTRRAGLVLGGLLFGVAPLLVRWFVVLPLKGAGIAEGLQPQTMMVFVGFHLIFGLGLAILYRAALPPERVDTQLPGRAVRG